MTVFTSSDGFSGLLFTILVLETDQIFEYHRGFKVLFLENPCHTAFLTLNSAGLETKYEYKSGDETLYIDR